MRQMTLVAFLQAQNCTNLAMSWRHPLSRADSWSPDFYRHIGRVLEDGKFHMAFFDDRLSMPDMYGRNHAHTVQHGIRCVKLDAVTVLTVMGMATQRLGLGATYSTSYYEPFHVARVFATVDLMTHGRSGWNVVTSVNDNEARNMGRDEVIAHDLRYDRADEFMEIVLGHWDTWEDDAIVADKQAGLGEYTFVASTAALERPARQLRDILVDLRCCHVQDATPDLVLYAAVGSGAIAVDAPPACRGTCWRCSTCM